MRRAVSKLNNIRPIGRSGTRRLDRAGSLGGLVARAARANALSKDPTGALDRATRLVEAARKARRICKKRLRTLHIGPNGRVVYARAHSAADLPGLTAELGDIFTQALNDTGLVITVITRTAPPPAGALRIEDFKRRAKAAAARVRTASAALALGGFAAAAYASPAHAEEHATPMQSSRRDGDAPGMPMDMRAPGAPVATLTTQPDWACSFTPPERVWTVSVRMAGSAISQARMSYGANENGAGAILAFANGINADLLRADPLAIVGPNGERIVALTRYGDPNRVDLQIASCAAEAQAVAAPVAPELPPAFDRAYRETSVDYIDRTEQEGLVASGASQWTIAQDTVANVQLAIGQIDGELAIGGQVAAQRFLPIGSNADVAIGAFLSAVNSTAPNDEELGIYRAGGGVSVIGEETQIVVRGGYASSDGFSDKDGAFVRVEAAWFPIERLSFEAFAEDDPITGAGYGAGVAARPFSDVFSNLMIDADMAWHEEGEESFRIGLRWLIGDSAAQASERDRRRQRGMSPYLPQEFERLPDDEDNKQPYGGAATGGPVSAASSAAFLE